MIYFSLVIDGELIDLYKDESIELNRQIKDYSDISSVFTDFSKNFNIPATDSNNRIFQNFFDENVLLQSWNQNYALSGQIYIHGLPVFDGVIELLEVKFTNGLPSDYSIVFYGKVKNVLVKWGEKTLQEIDWSAYNHTINNSVAVSSWSGGLLAGKIVWDVKDYGYGYHYSTYNVSNNIAKQGGIDYTNLRPSILLSEMINNLFVNEGYTLGGTLLSRPEFTNLYVTPMNTAGPFLDLSNGTSFGNFNANNSTAQALVINSNTMKNYPRLPIGNTIVSGNVGGGWNATNYEYTFPQNGNYTFQLNITSLTGNTDIFIIIQINNKSIGYYFTITSGIKNVWLSNCQKGDILTFIYSAKNAGTILGSIACIVSPQTINAICNIADAMPEIKVQDLFNSILKTFNAIIVPTSLTSFELHNIEDWYALGQNVEYTEFIDFKTLTHKKMPIPKSISMEHEEGNSISQDYFKKTYKREFGSVEFSPDVDFADNGIAIKSQFQVNPITIIRQVNQQGIMTNNTDLEIPAIYDADAKAVQQKLNLFYFNGMTATNYPWYFGTTQYTSYPKSSPFSGTTTNSYSLAFGLEANFTGDMSANSLYFGFWNKYVSRLYSTRSRIVIVNAVIPVGVWLNMKLNDNIAISGNYYKIQSIKYDLLSQRAVMELITYPNVNILQVTSTTGKRPTFNTIVGTDGGKTFIDGNPLKKGIGNAISDGTVYTTDGVEIENYNESNLWQFLPIKNNLSASLSLNKISIWRTTATNVTITPTKAGIPLIDSGSEGDSSYYTATLSTSQITINSDGQYRFSSSVMIEVTGGHHIGVGIYIDGVETEAYSEGHSNILYSMDVRGTASIGQGQVVQLRIFTLDGGSHNESIKRANLIIEKII